MSYQLDDPGVVVATTFTSCSSLCLWVKRVNDSNFGSKPRNEIRYSRKFVLHKIRTQMRVAIDYFLATVPDPLLYDDHRRSRHHERTDPMMPVTVHAATF
jgi:hypothetical protein